jgi:hypothetical protein
MRMAKWSQTYHGKCGNSSLSTKEAEMIANQFNKPKNVTTSSMMLQKKLTLGGGPLWLAASIDNSLPDVCGTLYLVALNLSTSKHRQNVMNFIVNSSFSETSASSVY